MIDDNDSWSILTAPGKHTDLSESELEGGDGGTLADQQVISLGSSAWIRNATEDLQFFLLHTNGTIEEVTVGYTGNNGVPFERSDLDFNGVVNASDWPIYRAGLEADLSGMSPAQAYQMGDLDYDGVNSILDFGLFKSDFDAANGEGAFAAMLAGVPEPSCAMLMLLLCGLISLHSRRAVGVLTVPAIAVCKYALRAACILLCALLSIATTGIARAQQVNIAVGKPAAQSTTLNDNSLYAASKGNNGIIGTTTADITHTDFDDLSPYWEVDLGGEFSIENVRMYNRTDNGFCCGERLYNITVEIFDASTASVYTTPVEDTFNPWDGSGDLPPDPLGGPFDFDLTGEPGGSVTGQTVRINKAAFTGSEWLSLVEVEVYVPLQEVPRIGLQVNRTTGNVSLVNNFSESFSTDFYRISSAGNSLNAASWNSLDAQNFDSIGGGEGESWDIAGGIDTGESQVGVLAEAFLQGSSPFGASASHTLGAAYNTTVDAQDLVFEYRDADTGEALQGFVEYVMTESVDGDYNHNGIVDAADYTVWRDSLNQTGAGLAADGDGNNVVNQDDYTYWKNRFGNTSGSGSSAVSAAVPEPSALALALLGCGLVGWLFSRRRATTALLAVAALAAGSSVATAAVTLDRDYTFGEDSLEGTSQGQPLGFNNTSPLIANATADSMGPTNAYMDLEQQQTSGPDRRPTYQDVDSSGGLARPGATNGTYGARFDGVDDYLQGIPLNRPDELISLAPSFPLDYSNVTARGLQMWVYPDAAKVGTARQVVVMDTIAAGGVAITADGRWTQIFDGHADDTAIGGSASVTGNQWYHVMQHVYPTDDPGAPNVVAGSGSDDLGFSSVMYVNGIAVSASNDTPEPGDLYSGPRVGALTVGAAELVGDGLTLTAGDYFQGVVDDLEMYVFDDTYGTFDLFADNEWIANEITTLPGGTLKMGDLNRDGSVGPADAAQFIANWRREKRFEGAHNELTAGDWETWGWGDLDHDGVVFLADAFLLHQALISATGKGLDFSLLGSGPTVPEPATLLLVGIGVSAFGLTRTRRKRR